MAYMNVDFLKMRQFNTLNSRIDMHMHTTWTDGKNSMQEMVSKAIENGLSQIAITEHIREQSNYYSDYISEAQAIKKKASIDFFFGFESKIKSVLGDLDISDAAMKAADIIVASVHRIPYGGEYLYPKEISYDDLCDLEREMSISVIRKNEGRIILGHCGGMSIAAYGKFPEDYFRDIIIECVKYNAVFEFNYKYHHIYENLLKDLLLEFNPYVSVGSDAHDVGMVSKRSFINE